MNILEGAPFDQAFNTIGIGDNKDYKKQKDVKPRDDTGNELNRVNFKKDLEEVKQKYENVINTLNKKLKELSSPKPNLIENFLNINSPDKFNELIMFILIGSFIIILCNCMFNFGKKSI
jgi:hypothetical protein